MPRTFQPNPLFHKEPPNYSQVLLTHVCRFSLSVPTGETQQNKQKQSLSYNRKRIGGKWTPSEQTNQTKLWLLLNCVSLCSNMSRLSMIFVWTHIRFTAVTPQTDLPRWPNKGQRVRVRRRQRRGQDGRRHCCHIVFPSGQSGDELWDLCVCINTPKRPNSQGREANRRDAGWTGTARLCTGAGACFVYCWNDKTRITFGSSPKPLLSLLEDGRSAR